MKFSKKIKLNSEPKIAIIGGGPMGLGVSYQLAQDGFKSAIFEADDRLGGMAASFDFKGINIERYYHFHCLSDKAFFKLLKELNLKNQIKWKRTKMGFFFKGYLYEWGSPISVLKFHRISIISRLRYLFHALRCLSIRRWDHLDKIPASVWLKKWLGDNGFDVLWSRLFEYKFYNYKDKISAAWIWSRIKRLGLSRRKFKETLGVLQGGSNKWITKLEKILREFGVKILLNHPVKKIAIERNRLKLYTSSKKIEEFDIVISTVPLPIVGKILDPNTFSSKLINKYLNQISIPCVCVILKTKKKITNNFWTNINDARFSIPGIIEFSNLSDIEPYITYIPFYMPKDRKEYSRPDEEFINDSIDCLLALNKEFDKSDVIDSHCSRYEFAQPISKINHFKNLPPINPSKNFWTIDTSIYYPEDRGVSESIDYGRNIAKKIIESFKTL